jgi:DNA-binding cell septation regulator SpoVG
MTIADFRIENFRAVNKNSLLAFCTVHMPSGMIINDVAIRRNSDGYWASPPSRMMTDRDGQPLRGDDDKPIYRAIVDFDSRKLRERWSGQVIAALREQYPETVRDG